MVGDEVQEPSVEAVYPMMSNTGWTSVGELEMTRRISLVAVCCSRVSTRSRLRASSSLKSRTFSMAITAWSANVSRRATCRWVKSCTSVRRMLIEPIATPSRIKGTLRMVRKPMRRAFSLLSGNSSTSVCASATWRVRPSTTDRPAIVPRMRGRENSPMGPARIGP